jgi:glycerophosphoryl diester phosphodiesterase
MSRVPLLPDAERPLLFAHRGASALAPENTLAAFRLARELGAPGLELDIHLCATGELVVVHDHSLKRTAGRDALVADLGWPELAELDAGTWFGPEFSGERLPLLAQVLDEFPELYIDIELKTKKTKADPLPAALAAFLAARAVTDKGLPRRITVSSFNPLALAAFKRAAPDYATAVIWCADAEVPWFLRSGQGRWLAGCDYLKPIKTKATPLSLFALSRLGRRPVVPWTVDSPEEAVVLIRDGCAGVISNRPGDLVHPLGVGRP